MVQIITFLEFLAFKFCCMVLEVDVAEDFAFSRASTASSSLSRVWKIPICSSCFSKQPVLGSSAAFASSTESRGGITSSVTIPKLASDLEKKYICYNFICMTHTSSTHLRRLDNTAKPPSHFPNYGIEFLVCISQLKGWTFVHLEPNYASKP
jgi:hypothetical protein